MSGLLITVFSYTVWLTSCMPDTTYSLLLLSAFLYWEYKLDDVLNWNLMKQSIPLHSNGFCTGMVCPSISWAFFPPTEWLVARVGPAALKTLVLKRIPVLQTFCPFPEFEETDAWLFFPFPLLPSLSPLPVPDNLAVLFPCFSTALL